MGLLDTLMPATPPRPVKARVVRFGGPSEADLMERQQREREYQRRKDARKRERMKQRAIEGWVRGI